MGAVAVYQPKLLTYVMVNAVYGACDQVFMHNPDRWRSILVQLRCDALNASVDTGRYR